MSRSSAVVLAWTVLGVFLASGRTQGQGLPGLNLGFTTFKDGAIRGGPGLVFANNTQFFSAQTFKDIQGRTIPLPQPDFNIFVNAPQFIYLSEFEVVPRGKVGLDVVLPFVFLD